MGFEPGEIYWQMADKQKYIREKRGGRDHATVFERCVNRGRERVLRKPVAFKQKNSFRQEI